MKAVPKLQNGGGFAPFFTEYKPVFGQAPRLAKASGGSGHSSRPKEEDTEKGKLTEKELFSMLKDIDGLPNEMRALVNNLINTFLISNLTGRDMGDLATTYLSNLYQLKIAALNKTQYDEALKTAATNGSMNEPAISPNGKLIIQGEDGGLQTVSLEEYTSDPSKYQDRILTVSNIANLRAYDPNFIGQNEVFNVITNSMGFESFLKLVDLAKNSLGATTYTRNGNFTNEGKASKGLELLEKLKDDLRLEQIVGSVTLEGLYDYKLIDSDLMQQIKALTTYITTMIPERAKTWAAFKLGTSDKTAATRDLVFQYLLGSNTVSNTIETTYKGTIDHVMGNSKKSSGGSEEGPKEGFWRQAQSGKSGEETRYTLLSGKGYMGVDGKYYGTTPGMDHNKSLAEYLADSGVAYMVTDNKKITIGDVKISTDSFGDVMVNASSGAFVVTLPAKNGTVDFDVLEEYTQVMRELADSGIAPNTEAYARKQAELLKGAGLDHLVNHSTGMPKTERFGQFLVLEGVASSRTVGVSDRTNKKYKFDDIRSNFLVNAGDDADLYRVVQDGLSTKDGGKYSLDDPEWWNPADSFSMYDKLYKGNIYIPINNNPNNAFMADGNDIKESTAKRNELATLIWNKLNGQGSIDSNALIQ